MKDPKLFEFMAKEELSLWAEAFALAMIPVQTAMEVFKMNVAKALPELTPDSLQLIRQAQESLSKVSRKPQPVYTKKVKAQPKNKRKESALSRKINRKKKGKK